MKTSLPRAAVAVLALGVAAAAPASASAATVKPTGSTSSTSGYDVAAPQCTSTLPTAQAFAVVGVNGGKATTSNPCLGAELQWAAGSSGSLGATQPKVQLYVNTADPGQVISQVNDWPTSSVAADPYGTCSGPATDSVACSWEYGYERAENDVSTIFAGASPAPLDTDPADYVWWLDVETSNTWETGSSAALTNNQADLEGMVYAFTQVTHAKTGIYSTNSQWGQIAGTVPSTSTLAGLPSWMAGARTTQGAKSNCTNSAFVPGGTVTLSQYVSGGLDHDVSCG